MGAAEAVKSRCDYKNNLSPATTSRLSGAEADSVCDFVPNLPFNSRVVVYPEVIQSVTCGSIPRSRLIASDHSLTTSAFVGTNPRRGGCCGQAGELSWSYVRGSFVHSARFLETGSQVASP